MGFERFARAAAGRRRWRAGAGSADRRSRRVPRPAGASRSRHDFSAEPDDDDERIKRAAALGRGFLYGISRLGVTGARDTVADGAAAMVARIRSDTTLPIALGFGISRPDHVAEIGRFADAAVVGSALVKSSPTRAGRHAGDGVEHTFDGSREPFRSSRQRELARGEHDRRAAPTHRSRSTNSWCGCSTSGRACALRDRQVKQELGIEIYQPDRGRQQVLRTCAAWRSDGRAARRPPRWPGCSNASSTKHGASSANRRGHHDKREADTIGG